jgi:glucose/arabinose dehydrogenase
LVGLLVAGGCGNEEASQAGQGQQIDAGESERAVSNDAVGTGSVDHLIRDAVSIDEGDDDQAVGLTDDAAGGDVSVGEQTGFHSCAPPTGAIPTLTAELVASGFIDPVGVEASQKDLSRLYVLEKAGKIRLIRDGVLLQKPFLDLTNVVWSNSEAGLLGLAFHPDYEQNGRFWIYYTIYQEGGLLAEFHRSDTDPDVADPMRVGGKPVYTAMLSFIHQGGGLKFGGDGFLYLALGERGLGAPAQDIKNHVGKILRFDVTTYPYTAPPGNIPNALPEVWDYGLRNPWRISFDLCNGDFYIGDVGDVTREEIDIEPRGMGNRNYGWPIMEGNLCYPAQSECDGRGITLPAVDYGHDVMNVIIGGYVYRGSSIPALRSRYVYGDIAGHLYALTHSNGVVTSNSRLPAPLLAGVLVSFGQDAAGEIYTVEMTAGKISRLKIAESSDASTD